MNSTGFTGRPLQPANCIGLPKTIEGARSRYHMAYRKQFRGEHAERIRLLDLFDTRCLNLEEECRNFYHERFAKLVNQAASRLLACNVDTDEGRNKFNQNHMKFLRVMDDLKRSQPTADREVSLDVEIQRVEERDSLIKESDKLRKEIEILKAQEVDLNEINSDDEEDPLEKMFIEIKRKEKLLEINLTKLAHLQGDNPEEASNVNFDLKRVKHSKFAKLSDDHFEKIQREISKCFNNNRKLPADERNPLDVDQIQSILSKLDLTDYEFTSDDIVELIKDIHKSYTKAVRSVNLEDMIDHHEYYLQSAILKPKEGDILNDPYDVPEDVKRIFDEHEQHYRAEIEKQKIDDEPLPIEDGKGEDIVNRRTNDDIDEDEDSHDSFDELLEKAKEEIRTNPELYSRVKEEPKAESDESSRSPRTPPLADSSTNGHSSNMDSSCPIAVPPIVGLPSTSREPQHAQWPEPGIIRNNLKEDTQSNNDAKRKLDETLIRNGDNRVQDNDNRKRSNIDNTSSTKPPEVFTIEDSDDDDCQDLGVVEPKSKITYIDLE